MAIDLKTKKRVAIKFLKVSNQSGMSKHKALECLIKEIKILADSDHPNIAQIIEASLDGVIVKEYPACLATIGSTANFESEIHKYSTMHGGVAINN